MRQFISAAMPDADGRLILTNIKERKYLLRVLRLSAGSAVDVRLPDGSLLPMVIADHRSDSIELVSAAGIQTQSSARGVGARSIQKSAVEFWLFQFMTKPQKMDIIIRQAAEVGMSRILPVRGSYSPIQEKSLRQERWERIIKEARQQSGSPTATQVFPPMQLEEAAKLWLSERGSSYHAILMNENTDSPPPAYPDPAQHITQAALAVGCEGGMTQKERDTLMEIGFKPVHFKTNILRAETAALYGMAVLQTSIMEGLECHLSA